MPSTATRPRSRKLIHCNRRQLECTRRNLISTAPAAEKLVARVRVYSGTGKIIINDRDIDDYFGLETLKLIVRQPLVVAGVEGKFDIVVRVSGGGVSGQAGAIRHGLSRALLVYDENLRPELKKAGSSRATRA